MPRYTPSLSVLILSFVWYVGATAAAGIWLDVPFVKQEKDGCGAASISMVMRYWSKDMDPAVSERADPRAIQRELYSDDVKGILGTSMEWYFQKSGFRMFAFQGEWTDLKHHISLGRPLIVAVKESGPKLHYLVVVGLDWQNGFVFVNDPAQRKLMKLEWAEFEKNWNGTGRWTLLVVPKQGE